MPFFFDSSKLKKEFLQGMGQRLRNAREQSGFSVTELSCLLNITENVYSKIEVGKFSLSCDMMVTVKRVLSVSLDWLFTGEEQKPGAIVLYQDTSFPNGLMGVNHPQLILDGICILLNQADFNLCSAAILKDDKGIHLLTSENCEELLYGEEFQELEEAKTAFIKNFGDRYLLQADEPKTNWSEWFTTEREGSNEIYLDAVGVT